MNPTLVISSRCGADCYYSNYTARGADVPKIPQIVGSS